MDTPWLTRAEAAQYLRVTESTIQRLVRDKRLVEHTVAETRTVRYHLDDLDAVMVKAALGTEPA